jgi:hypothetical protein
VTGFCGFPRCDSEWVFCIGRFRPFLWLSGVEAASGWRGLWLRFLSHTSVGKG